MRRLFIPFFALGLSAASAHAEVDPSLDLTLQVRTLFAHECYHCHSSEKVEGGLRLDGKEHVFAGGESGAIFEPGKPDESEILYRVMVPRDDFDAMPPEGDGLSAEQIALLRKWIETGAPWPDGAEEFSVFREAPLAPRKPDLPETASEHPVDRFLDAYFKKNETEAPPIVGDRLFLKRSYLDAIGLLPTPEEARHFLQSEAPNKREQLVDDLLGRNEDYALHWMTFWNDALRNDYTGTGYITGGRKPITEFVHNSLLKNEPYDEFVRSLIAPDEKSAGFITGISWRGTVNSSQTTEMQAAQNVSQVFLGLNLKCASCHDSFINNWTLDQAYSFATIFAEKPLEIARCDVPTGKTATQGFLFPELGDPGHPESKDERLQELAKIMTKPENGRLSRTLVNRLWKQLLGRGIVEPVDSMDNLPWDEDLLDWLAWDFAEHGYDIKHTLRRIMTSKAYQMESAPVDDPEALQRKDFQFKGPVRRRLSAEQFADAVSQIIHPLYENPSFDPKSEEPDPYVRAVLVANDPFLTALGRPNRENVTTSRDSQATLLQALELTNGQFFASRLRSAAELWKERYAGDPSALIDFLTWSSFARPATSAEQAVLREQLGEAPSAEAIEDLLWSIVLLPEFQLIY